MINETYLVADSRERLPLRAIRDSPYIKEIQTLLVGDYQDGTGTVGFERKEGDFGNYKDVQRAVHEMKQFYKYPHLIVTRRATNYFHEGGNKHYGTRIGFVASLIQQGMPPLFIDNYDDAINVMHRIAMKQLDGNNHGGVYDPTRVVKTSDRQVNMLMMIPGIGRQKAKDILENFGSPKKFFNADDETILRQQGIGPKILSQIRKVVG